MPAPTAPPGTGEHASGPHAPGPDVPFDRAAMVARLERESFDVVVVGGGITGAGVALDAVARGLSVACVERDDFASGTSSRSSKLVHGGLRYLQNGDVRLVYEALHERQRLLRNAPHLVEVLSFVIPVLTRDGVISRKVARALGSALWMYDLTGGWRIGRRHRRLDAAATLAHVPTLPADRVAGGYLYHDATADDARLTLTVLRTAAARGAVVVNRAPVVAFTPDDPSAPVNGVVVRDQATGRTVTVRAGAVVNATGVWVDALHALDRHGSAPTIRPARGVHVTIPWERVRNDVAVIVPVPGDKRSLFVVPWGDRGDGTFRHAYVGTTDTDHDGPLDDPLCTADDLEYVLTALNRSLSADGAAIGPDDVTGVWAGLRPLVVDPDRPGPAAGPDATGATRSRRAARTADLSRTHRVSVSERGVVTIAGGKLTTYRAMAEDTVDAVLDARRRPPANQPANQPADHPANQPADHRADHRAGGPLAAVRRLGRRVPVGRRHRSPTRRLRLVGATRDLGDAGSRWGHLRRRYGTEADRVAELIQSDPTLGDPLVPGLPHLRAEAVFAVRHEMATTLDDVLVRRTRCHLVDRDATEAAAPAVAELLASELGWDAATTAAEITAYRARCDAEREALRSARAATGSAATEGP